MRPFFKMSSVYKHACITVLMLRGQTRDSQTDTDVLENDVHRRAIIIFTEQIRFKNLIKFVFL